MGDEDVRLALQRHWAASDANDFAAEILRISELVLKYDETPFYVVSIMEFEGDEVVRETQYFGKAFAPGPSRAQWVERME